MKLCETSRDDFVAHLTKDKADKFAHTFVAKCDMMKAWDKCMGVWVNEKLAGAIVVTISKRKPISANLQLLHTFNEFRGKGVASLLCEHGLQYAFDKKAEYFRVSAELDAVAFYEKFGFKMVCKQKTAKLAMLRLQSPNIHENDMKLDHYIWKQMNRKGKGGCIECYVEFEGVDFFMR
jgi:ribosomal protein S18 acetylase RimI-like enzyme